MKLTPYQHGQKAYKNGLTRSFGADYDFCDHYEVTGIINQEYLSLVDEWRKGFDDARYQYFLAEANNNFKLDK